ncbi:hypothetical protein AVEN_39476-1 [Araneus ventricosus]|uniref:Uncharacterized protein n=1 Tax=Araneus ventricosus TaxID=182803 RepID=A0A4Y2D7A7_ARAVE|nr:hypothetical protein AVEN_39476-1 [Araneus ventricosus]
MPSERKLLLTNSKTQRNKTWGILLLYTIAMVIKAFVTSVPQRIETGIEEISVKILDPHQDGLLNFGIGSQMPISQELLQRSERESPGARSELYGGFSNNSPRKGCTKSSATEAVCGRALPCTCREQFCSFTENCHARTS